MNKVLITGAQGVLGTELGEQLTKYYIPYVGVDLDVDIRDCDAVQRCMLESECDIVFHCAAITDVPGCETNKQLAYDVNVTGARNVALAARQCGLFMVSMSTDYVFRGDKVYNKDGAEGNYNIDDFLDPINYYSFTKVLAEQAVLDIMEDRCLVPRLSFKRKGPWPYLGAFVDQYTSRDTSDIIANQIVQATFGGFTGIVHLGTRRKTVFDLAQRQSPNVRPISINDIKDVILPKDTSLKLTEIPEVLK